jgi:hypothetical protein
VGDRLDRLARDLANGEVSRRSALKSFGGALAAAAVAAPASVFASLSDSKTCPPARRCGDKCCPKHAVCNRRGNCKCVSGYTKCGHKCVNLQTNKKHCGSCTTACPPAAHGSCQRAACLSGNCGFVTDDTNTPASTQCATGTCQSGVPAFVPLNAGTPCNDGGVVCDGAGACVECVDDSQCSGTNQCDQVNHICVPDTCNDGQQNHGETDVDCGGPCGPCADGKGCSSGADCQSGVCSSGTCVAASTCGNGMAEPGEQCDGADLKGETCQSRGFAGGTLACAPNCTFDTSGCLSQICGNGVREGTEVCDGSDLNGQTCAGFGFTGGTLACAPNCGSYDASGCTCASNTQSCDGLASTGCECMGTGCCGSLCQVVHSDGTGQNYFDCTPLGTYNSPQAMKACNADTNQAGTCRDGFIAGSGLNTQTSVCKSVDPTGQMGSCTCWAYSGTGTKMGTIGHVSVSANACQAPLATDPSWT